MMYRYSEQTVKDNYFENKYSLYIVDVSFSNFVDSFINVGGAPTVVAKTNSQEELFNLEPSAKTLPHRTSLFEPSPTSRCRYIIKEIKIYDYENREPKSACVDYGLLTHISENKNNLGIDPGIVPINVGYNMQKHDDRHNLWAHALGIYGSSKMAFHLQTSRLRPDVPKLSWTPVLNVSAYVQKLPNVTSDDITQLDAHLAQALLRLTTMGVDNETKQANSILMSSFT